MKKVLLTIMFLCLPVEVIFASCTNDEREELQKLADNISYIMEENEQGSFDLTFSGIAHQVKIFDDGSWIYYRNLTNNYFGESTVKNLKLGATYKFEVHTNNSNCLIINFRTITVNVPNKNPYYNDKICENAKNYYLCQKWSNVQVSYEEFTQKVQNYIDENKNNDKYSNENEEPEKFSFMSLYNRYYWPTFIIMILLLIIIMIFWFKENKKNKL